MSDDKITIHWPDYRGREVTRDINQTLDARDFLGTAIYPWLIIAANTRLSVGDLERFLHFQARETPGVARSSSWIQRRRWMAQPPGTDNIRNRDGKDARAFGIMSENPKLSLYKLSVLLKAHGIIRSREWVRLHRCRKPTTTHHIRSSEVAQTADTTHPPVPPSDSPLGGSPAVVRG